MARYELSDVDAGIIGSQSSNADVFYRLGMMYATGRSVALDLISAHKWFNIAAAKGNAEAVRYRSEVAREMTRDEVAEALRAARQYLMEA
jgi:TPR repeat protein